MPAVSITVQNLKAVRDAMSGSEHDLQVLMVRAMHDAVDYAVNFLAKYPPPPPNSTYHRSGTLGRKWTKEVVRTAYPIRGVIGNLTPYTEAVQDRDHQAKIHRGRWRVIQQIGEDKQIATIRGIFADAIQDWERGLKI